MQIETMYFSEEKWHYENESIQNKLDVDLVLIFGATDVLEKNIHYTFFAKQYKNAQIIGASSAGNVLGAKVSDKDVVATAISLDKGYIKTSVIDFTQEDDFNVVSQNLVAKLPDEKLKSIFIISDGLSMNGTALAHNVNKIKPNTLITGGLAGDDARFEKTLVIANDHAKNNRMVAIGFSGDDLHVSSGC